jgi:hypothetical protein
MWFADEIGDSGTNCIGAAGGIGAEGIGAGSRSTVITH